MIEGVAVRLRAWGENDLPDLVALRNDVALQAQLLARVRGSGVEQVRNWLQDRTSSPDKLIFIIADRETDATLGFVQITGMDLADRRAELGICLKREAQGHRAGTESLRLTCAYLRDTWGLRKVSLKVRADNAVAIHCYRRVGFESCGLLRQHVFIEGAWQDIMLMDQFLVPES
jgi:diamine N-acetyltransferase